MDNEYNRMRSPEEGTPTGAGPGTGVNASGQRPRNSRRLGRGYPETQSTEQRSQITAGSPPAESAAPTTEELTQAGLPRRRIKWTYEMNVSVMRAFFKATREGADMLHYRQLMRTFFLMDYPNLHHLTQQNLSDRKRAIERRNLLPTAIIEQICREVQNEPIQQLLQEISSENTINENFLTAIQPEEMENTSRAIPMVTAQHSNAQNQHSGEVNAQADDLVTSTLVTFNIAKAQYTGMSPDCRPHLPKPIVSKRTIQIISILNTMILPTEITQTTQYHQIIDLIYCSAYTIVTMQDNHKNRVRRTDQNGTGTIQRKPNGKPQWQIRLERKIEDIRKDLGYLISYKDNRVSLRNRGKFNRIRKRHLIHTRHEPNNETVEQIVDTVKQKLNRTVDKYRRYLKSYNRRSHNANFNNSEKRFYDMLKRRENSSGTIDDEKIPIKAMESFWSSVWSTETEHNRRASWLPTIVESASNITDMTAGTISIDIFKKTVSKVHNWKQPGPDKIHNFYYKYLQSLHQPLLNIFNEFLGNSETIPLNMCKGITYLKPKIDNPTSPSQFRPITCLNTGYKLFTACLTSLINMHCESNKIISMQQKGCRAGTKGCKDQLVIDSIIVNQAIRDKRNMYAAFIDYQKAFDSIPHSWLAEIIRIYKLHANIIKCFETMKKAWRTQLSIYTTKGIVTSDTIAINRGIYQGDSLSPLLFCLALNPLSHLLVTSQYGYRLRTSDSDTKISHSLYMDDLKLYAGTRESLEKLLRIVEIFSDDVGMKFGIEKCRTQNVYRGKFTCNRNYTTSSNEAITSLKEDECYKYLGVQQSLRIEHSTQKKALTAELTRRLHQICKMRLNSLNITKAINTYAIPLLTYSFGIVAWSKTDLCSLNCKIRTTLTKYNYHHPKSALERVNLPRKRGGRGILNVEILHDRQINSLRKYFTSVARNNTIYRALIEADDKLTPLDLSNATLLPVTTMDDLEFAWKSKIIHGKYPGEISQEYVDLHSTHGWLIYGTLFPETEGHIVAIQDGVICTRNYMKYIVKERNITTDLCRRCGSEQETISHIINGCRALAATHYKTRHDLMGKIIHIEIAKQFKFLVEALPYYRYQAQPILENGQITIYWDRSILTDATINGASIPNRPDMIIINRMSKTAIIIDFANPLDGNMVNTVETKKRKYLPLSQFLKRIHDLDRVDILPVVISSTGTIPVSTVESIDALNLKRSILTMMQKAVLIQTSSIVREVLE